MARTEQQQTTQLTAGCHNTKTGAWFQNSRIILTNTNYKPPLCQRIAKPHTNKKKKASAPPPHPPPAPILINSRSPRRATRLRSSLLGLKCCRTLPSKTRPQRLDGTWRSRRRYGTITRRTNRITSCTATTFCFCFWCFLLRRCPLSLLNRCDLIVSISTRFSRKLGSLSPRWFAATRMLCACSFSLWALFNSFLSLPFRSFHFSLKFSKIVECVFWFLHLHCGGCFRLFSFAYPVNLLNCLIDAIWWVL